MFGPVGAMIGSIAYLTLSVIGLFYTVRRVRRLLPLLIYPWLYAAIFSIANPLIFRWYIAPPMPALMLGIVIGIWAVVVPVERRNPTRKAMRPKSALIAGGRAVTEALARARQNPAVAYNVLLVAAFMWIRMSGNAWQEHPDHGPDRPAPKMAWHKIELLYQEVGTELREKYQVTLSTPVGSADIALSATSAAPRCRYCRTGDTGAIGTL
jgi:hypothetical protein